MSEDVVHQRMSPRCGLRINAITEFTLLSTGPLQVISMCNNITISVTLANFLSSFLSRKQDIFF